MRAMAASRSSRSPGRWARISTFLPFRRVSMTEKLAGSSIAERPSTLGLKFIHSSANGREEEMLADLIEQAKSLQLVLDRVLELRKAEFHSRLTQGAVQVM